MMRLTKNIYWAFVLLALIQPLCSGADESGTNVTLHLTMRSTWWNRDFVVIETTIVNHGAEPIYIWKPNVDHRIFRFFDNKTKTNIMRDTRIISDPFPSYDNEKWKPSWDDICVVEAGKEYKHDIICRIEAAGADHQDSACQLSFLSYDQPLPKETQIRLIARYKMMSDDIIRKCKESFGVDLYDGQLIASDIVLMTDKSGIKSVTSKPEKGWIPRKGVSAPALVNPE